eukprot:TRINITY_DN6630_c0_g1_i1.p1 TRINITY_DN6630_c0_g1~~TRINITY_DN6630_c0_g1_i1.p1  ORF type:complete len:1420 (+),score=496.72 TRINITY_DN6630_c0_g1_i1:85-4344(+)
MYQAFNKILESSSVTCSCYGSLRHEGEMNLVVAKHDVLEVYTLNEEANHALILESVYPMGMSVDAMQTVQFPGHRRDFLVLAFVEAKITVLYWDLEENLLKVKSLHLLEEPSLAGEREPDHEVAPTVHLRIDPGGPGRPAQCLVILVNRRFLFILPFARPVGSLDWGGSSASTVAPEFPLERPGLIDLQADMGLTGIRDIAFVDGYFRPTVMVLHEAEQTWAGRLKLTLGDEGKVVERKSLTMAVSVVSLTLSNGKIDSSNRLIASKLPYNAFALVPLRYEPYGALILGANTILHVSHEQSAYGIHLNAYGEDELTSDPASQAHVTMGVLKDSNNAPISVKPRLVMSLAGAKCVSLPGPELYSFLALASGDVCAIKVSRNKQNGLVSDICIKLLDGMLPLPCVPKPPVSLPSCPAPSTLCCFGRYLFVGSASGDSMLLRRSEDVSTPLAFSKVLTLLNTGPVVDAVLGDSSIDLRDQDDDTEVFPTPSLGAVTSAAPIHLTPTIDRTFAERHATMEIVAATGKGKDGAVCILNRTIKPFTLCSHQMDIAACFALSFAVNQNKGNPNKRKRDEDEKDKADPTCHNYLVITTGGKQTIVMKAGKELAETDTPLLNEQTVFAASLVKDQMVMQITTTQVLVCDTNTKVNCDLFAIPGEQLSPDVTAHQACHEGTTAAILMSNGTVRVAKAYYAKTDEAEEELLQLEMKVPPLPTGPLGFVTAISMCSVAANDPFFFPTADIKETTDTVTLITLAWRTGTVQILDLAKWEVLFTFHGMLGVPDVATTDAPHSNNEEPFLEGIWMGKVDPADSAPHLLFVTSEDFLYSYKAYMYNNTLRWAKVSSGLSAGRRAEGTGPTAKLNELTTKLRTIIENGVLTSVFDVTPQQPRIQAFSNIFGNDGIFVRSCRGGLWGFSERGHLRLHDMSHMAPVHSMTPLNIPCCKTGFALATATGLKIMQLTWHKRMNFKAPWPTRKILLRSSPHKIVFDGQHRTYTLVVSTEHPFKPTKTAFDSEADAFITEMESESKKEVSPDQGIPIPTNGRYELLLYSAFSWKPFTCVALKENEQVLTFTSVQLSKTVDPFAHLRQAMPDMPAAKREVITLQVCGTGFPVSEDIPCRGRIILLRVRVGRTRDDRVLEIEHEVSTKGPVTAITSSESFIFAAVAAKIHVYGYEWNKKKLNLVAWCDVRMYTSSLSFFRKYVLVGDLFNSVQVLRWSEIGHTLTPLARDTNKLPVTSCEFQSERGTLGMICADSYGNISTFYYDPTLSSALLQPFSDIFIDTVINKMIRLRTFLPQTAGDLRMMQPGHQTALLFGTKSGSLCVLQPVSEGTHRDLHWLYSKMITEVEHFAGLHPRSCKKFRGRRIRKPDPKSRKAIVLDVPLISQFLTLPTEVQDHLSNATGFGSRQRAIATMLALKQETSFL